MNLKSNSFKDSQRKITKYPRTLRLKSSSKPQKPSKTESSKILLIKKNFL